jgi:hypothetical protein
MFDSTQEIPLTLQGPDGDKNVVVRYPSDEQFIDRTKKTKLVTRSLGRGKSKTEAEPNYKADLELLNAIKVSGDELDEYEASDVINRLTRCSVEDSRREGNRYIVVMKVPGGTVTHTTKIPSAKQAHNYGRAVADVLEGRHGLSELRLNPYASRDLYDAIMVSSEGYVGPVPQPHKEVVISEVMALLKSVEASDDVEGF